MSSEPPPAGVVANAPRDTGVGLLMHALRDSATGLSQHRGGDPGAGGETPPLHHDQHWVSALRRVSQFGGLRALGVALLFLSHILAARVMGVEDYGAFVYLVSWLNLLAILARLGFDTALLRDISAYRLQRDQKDLASYLLAAFAAPLALAVFLTFAIWSLSAWAGTAPHTVLPPHMIPALFALPLVTLEGIVAGGLRGVERNFTATACSDVVRPVILILGLVALAQLGSSVGALQAIAVWVLASGVSVMSLWLAWSRAHPLGRTAHRPRPEVRLDLVPAGLPFLALALVGAGITQADALLVGALLGPEAVGLYAAPARLILAVSFGAGTITVYYAPRIAALHAAGERVQLQRLLTIAAWLSTTYTVATAMVLVTFGRDLLALFGSGFTDAYPILLVLLVAPLVVGITGPTPVVANMAGLQSLTLRAFAFWGLANLAANVVLIHFFGLMGAAAATASTLAALNVTLLIACVKRLHLNPSVFPFLR